MTARTADRKESKAVLVERERCAEIVRWWYGDETPCEQEILKQIPSVRPESHPGMKYPR